MAKYPYQDDNFGKASEHMRLALALLGKYRIAPSPLNYRIGYEYIAGSNEGLRLAFDELAESGNISDDSLQEVYQRFFTEDEQAYAKLRLDLKNIILTVQSEFQTSGGSLSNYARTLSHFAEILETPAPPRAMSQEVQKVLDDTHTMRDSQSQMESNMTQMMNEMTALRKDLEKVKEESSIDALTGIANRKSFDTGLESAIKDSREQDSPFSLLLIDIDRFKQFNDSHGHLVGDKVLRFVASTIKRCIKGKDLGARYGGEEFAVILPDTNLSGAGTIAEQIRKAISARVLKDSNSNQEFGRITVSIGAGEYRSDELPNDIIGRADQALYQAKEQGRNRLVTAENQSSIGRSSTTTAGR